MKRILVVMIKTSGDEVSVSVKVSDGNFTVSDKKKLQDLIVKKLIPDVNDALYFRIRYNEKVGKSKGITKSVKVSSLGSLEFEINKMFSDVGIEDERKS